MCKMCMKHGAAGKWYLNAQNYLKETAVESNAYEYLEDLWGNLERAYLQKVYGLVNMKWVSKKIDSPLLGRVLKWYANKGFTRDGRYKKLKPAANQGHVGQIITLDEAKTIVIEKAETVAKALCPCKHFNRGIKDYCCLAFSPLLEVIPKLPRYIPETGIKVIDGDQAASFIDEMDKKGFVHTIWCGPVPTIIALCSCEIPSCGALRLRSFDLNTCWKGEYVAINDPDKCIGCRKCASVCQFGALRFSPVINRPIIKPELCYGCGLCCNRCENEAIFLVDRNDLAITRGRY